MSFVLGGAYTGEGGAHTGSLLLATFFYFYFFSSPALASPTAPPPCSPLAHVIDTPNSLNSLKASWDLRPILARVLYTVLVEREQGLDVCVFCLVVGL